MKYEIEKVNILINLVIIILTFDNCVFKVPHDHYIINHYIIILDT